MYTALFNVLHYCYIKSINTADREEPHKILGVLGVWPVQRYESHPVKWISRLTILFPKKDMTWVCCFKDKVVLKCPSQTISGDICPTILTASYTAWIHHVNILDCKTILTSAYKVQQALRSTERRLLSALLREKIGTIKFIFLKREFY